MKMYDRDKKLKIVSIQKRFSLMNYEYVYGSDQVESYIRHMVKKHERHRLSDSPFFDIMK